MAHDNYLRWLRVAPPGCFWSAHFFVMDLNLRFCKKCCIEKEVSSNFKGGQNYCNACKREKIREYRARPDIILKNKEYKSEYRSRPGVRDIEIQKQKEYRSNPMVVEMERQKQKEYTSRDDIRARNRDKMKWRRQNLPHVVEYGRAYNANHRAIWKCQKIGNYYEKFEKEVIFNRDGWVCKYCNKALLKGSLDIKTMPTIDHVIPISKGGPHTISNCVTSCYSCNSKKGSKILNDQNFKY